MLEKLKEFSPKIAAAISVAPFAAGLVIGYICRTPISWALEAISALIRI